MPKAPPRNAAESSLIQKFTQLKKFPELIVPLTIFPALRAVSVNMMLIDYKFRKW